MRLFEFSNMAQAVERLAMPIYDNGVVIGKRGGNLIIQNQMDDGSSFEYEMPGGSAAAPLKPGSTVSLSPTGAAEDVAIFKRNIDYDTVEIMSKGRGRPDRLERVNPATIKTMKQQKAEAEAAQVAQAQQETSI